MGVPGFFAWLVKKYPQEILAPTVEEGVHALYLDWNGGIHPVCRSILEKYRGAAVSRSDLEDEMIAEVLTYLKSVVSHNVPSDLLFIAIDGVAPRAKMNQQRSRRFKSAKDKLITNEIRRRHGAPLDFAWDTNAITPGTDFMKRLCAAIHAEILTNPFYTSKFRTIFSDASEPMEGEHKIISHIRTHPDWRCAIYGLDADLIFLSLLSSNSIHLMRERNQFGDVRGKTPFWYMQIDVLKTKLVEEIGSQLTRPMEAPAIVRDFVVYCFFLGNDFLPKFPCLFIHEEGIDQLIAAYGRAVEKTGTSLISGGSISNRVLGEILTELAVTEGLRLQLYHKKNRLRFSPRPGASPFEIEMDQYDSIWPPTEDVVQMGKRGWKDRYYEHFFGLNRFSEHARLNSIIGDYLKTMHWTWAYYATGLPSWEWCYPHHHAPTMSDVCKFIQHRPTFACAFELGRPVSTTVQLLCVLPPQSFPLLDPRVRSAVERSDLPYYPRSFGEDCIHKKKRWQTIPNIPFVQASVVQKLIDSLS